MGETEGDYIDRRLAVIPKLQQRIVDQENEIKRLHVELANVNDANYECHALSQKLQQAKRECDEAMREAKAAEAANDTFAGIEHQNRKLVEENKRLRADVLAWTKELAKVQAERDEARMLARKFHHGAFANLDKSKYSWLEDTDG